MRLSDITRDYWNVSLAFNGRRGASRISTGKALTLLSDRIENVPGPAWKRVHSRMWQLRQGIIEGKPAQRKQAK